MYHPLEQKLIRSVLPFGTQNDFKNVITNRTFISQQATRKVTNAVQSRILSNTMLTKETTIFRRKHSKYLQISRRNQTKVFKTSRRYQRIYLKIVKRDQRIYQKISENMPEASSISENISQDIQKVSREYTIR